MSRAPFEASAKKGALLALALLGPFLFPWPLTATLAILAAIYFPLAPLSVGLLTDALYYAHGAALVPWWSIIGLIATLIAYGVRSFFEASIMRS